MSQDEIRYDKMFEAAMRGVARDALAQVAAHGLPGAHHFYITFRTDHPGVVMDDDLKERYPEEMTIVLRLQFQELVVESESFAVTLHFNHKPKRLTVPFEAITVFADPAVNFTLQFQGVTEDEDEEGDGAEAAAPEPPATDDKAERPKGEVVSLDTFRKK